MSIFRRGKIWHYDFLITGNRYRGSTGLTQKTLAKESVARMKQKILEQGAGILRRKPVPLLKDFIPDFLQEIANLHGGNERHKTVVYHRTNFRRLSEFADLANTTLDQIDERLIAEYTQWRLKDGRVDQTLCKADIKDDIRPRGKDPKPISPSTVNRELQSLRRALRLALRWKILSAVPQFELLKEETGRERVITHEEEQQYLQAAEQPLRDIATLIVDCGLRPGECFGLRVEDVRFATGTVHIQKGKTKYARRALPMTARVREVLQVRVGLKKGTDWLFPAETASGHLETVKKQHEKAIVRAKIEEPFVPYCFRHTYGTRLGECGADAFTIQKLMGHSSVLISQRYVHPSPEQATNAVKRLERFNLEKMGNLRDFEMKSPQNSPHKPRREKSDSL